MEYDRKKLKSQLLKRKEEILTLMKPLEVREKEEILLNNRQQIMFLESRLDRARASKDVRTLQMITETSYRPLFATTTQINNLKRKVIDIDEILRQTESLHGEKCFKVFGGLEFCIKMALTPLNL